MKKLLRNVAKQAKSFLLLSVAVVSGSALAQLSREDAVWEPSDGVQGVTCKHYNRLAYFEWVSSGGDWIDNNGVVKGPTPQATITQTAGPTVGSKYNVTIPSALWDKRIWFIRYIPGNPNTGAFQISARELGAASAAKLIVTLTNSTVQTYTVMADSTIFGTAASCNADTGTILAINDSIYLGWPQLPATNTIASVTMEVTLARDITSTVNAGIYAGVIPRKAKPALVPALSAGFPNDVGLAAHPDVLSVENFNRSTITTWMDRTGGRYVRNQPSTWGCSPLAGTGAVVDPNSNGICDTEERIYYFDLSYDSRFLEETVNGTTNGFWRSWIRANDNAGAYAPSVLFPGVNSGDELDEAYVRFDVRFSDGWRNAIPCPQFPPEGKLTGLTGNVLASGNSGRPGNGIGWSARFEYHNTCPNWTENALVQQDIIVSPIIYLYHTDQLNQFGDNISLAGTSDLGLWKSNEWHTIEQRVKMNTINDSPTPGADTANFDGILEVWIDGYKVYSRNNIRWRLSTDEVGPYLYNPENSPLKRLAIWEYWGTIHHGGNYTWGASATGGNVYVDIDNIVTAKQRIGPLVATAPTNRTPVVATTIPVQSATSGVSFSYTFPSGTFSDPDGDTLTYTATSLPSWMTFVAGTRTFSGTPTGVGNSTITVRATDPSGLFAETPLNVIVSGSSGVSVSISPTPVIAGGATTVSWANIQSASGSFFLGMYAPGATSSQHNGNWFYVNCTQTPGATIPAGSCPFTVPGGTASGQYEFRLYNASQVLQTFTVFTVGTPNNAPTVATPIPDQTATEDAAFNFQFSSSAFSDPGDTLTYTATNVPSWLTFTPGTRTFIGSPTNVHAGTVTAVTVRATDTGGLFVTDTFNITAVNSNDAPAIITPIADTTGAVGVAFAFSFAADAFIDVDAGDVMTYTASGMPGWMTFSASTRTFSGTPNAAGTTNVTVRATDIAGAFVEDVFAVVVGASATLDVTPGSIRLDPGASVNVAWSGIAGATNTNWFGFYPVGTTLSTAHNGNWLYVNCSKTPTVVIASGNCQFTIPSGALPGQYEIKLYTALHNLIASDTLTLLISNNAPTVSIPIPPQQTSPSALFNYAIPSGTFIDVETAVLTYTASGMPAWMTFNGTTFTGTPALSDTGVYFITVRATDDAGEFVETTLTLSVDNCVTYAVQSTDNPVTALSVDVCTQQTPQ